MVGGHVTPPQAIALLWLARLAAADAYALADPPRRSWEARHEPTPEDLAESARLLDVSRDARTHAYLLAGAATEDQQHEIDRLAWRAWTQEETRP